MKHIKKMVLLYFLAIVINVYPSITVLGTGYVGLVLSAGLAELGHDVICADIDMHKIRSLDNLKLPFFEPNLEELVIKHYRSGNLTFTNNLADAIHASTIIYIAVGTPSQEDGSADLQYVQNAFNLICDCLNEENEYKIICMKSTVPVGTAQTLHQQLELRKLQNKASIISNPEFLRQGSAITDLFNPDRTIIGGTNQKDMEIIRALFGTITQDNPVVFTDNTTAELIKYVSNTFLAVKLSFINEVDSLSSKVNADIATLIKAVGLDKRIGPHYMQPGPGFGGSCLPKDSRALIFQGNQHGIPMRMTKAALEVNQDRKHAVVERIKEKFNGNITGKKIGIVGLAFKPNTDDIRESPAIDIIKELLGAEAVVYAYDPIASHNMKKIFPMIEYVGSKNEIIEATDHVVTLLNLD